MNYYHINKDTLTIISGPHQPQSTYIKRLTSCGNPELLDLAQYNLVPEVLSPLATGQKYGDPVVRIDKVEIPSVSKSAYELAADLAMNVLAMEESCRQYIENKGDMTGASGRVHFTAAPMIFDKAKANKPKSAAIKAWVEGCWMLYYQRLAELTSGTPFSNLFLDFGIAGPCPFSILESMQE